MNKKNFLKYLVIILAGGLAGFILSVMFANRLVFRLSSVPVLRDYKIVTSSAPIVIHTKEEVRLRGESDSLEAAQDARRKTSAVVTRVGQKLVQSGSAVNVSVDGLFLTAQSALPTLGTNYERYIQLSTGEMRLVAEEWKDPVTGLVMVLAAGGGNVSVANFARMEQAASGQQVAFLAGLLGSDRPYILPALISRGLYLADNVEAGLMDENLGLVLPSGLMPGQAVVETSGDILGIWNGSRVIFAGAADNAVRHFLAGQKKFVRPFFGFTFHTTTAAEAKLFGRSSGVLSVESVLPNSPAASIVKVGDIITAIGGKKMSEISFTQTLVDAVVGEALKITAERGGKEIEFSIIPVLRN